MDKTLAFEAFSFRFDSECGFISIVKLNLYRNREEVI